MIYLLRLVSPDGEVYEACTWDINCVYKLNYSLAGWTIGFIRVRKAGKE